MVRVLTSLDVMPNSRRCTVESDTGRQLARSWLPPRVQSLKSAPTPPRGLAPYYRPAPLTPFPITALHRGLVSPLPPRPAVLVSH